jgi:LuxR family maltose regulon positive regulatory protein
VHRGAEDDLRLALQILDVLEEIASRTHNTRYRIEILALRALALDSLGETSKSDSDLQQSLELARPGGFIRIYIDLGKRMQELLSRLASQGQCVEMIGQILAAFQAENRILPAGEARTLPANPPSNVSSTLTEPLTPRELEILALLRGPLNIKEIALQLHISHATAKRHTIHIYAKLGVSQRWNAVARAEELNLLPPR